MKFARSGQHSVIPGFRLTMGFTVLYLSLLVLIPLSTLVLCAGRLSWEELWHTFSASRTLAAYRLSLGGALIAAGGNAIFGLLIAWVLVRYRFPGRRVLDALVDLPFALPTAVAGISLTAIYAPTGVIGGWLAGAGIQAAYSPLGIIIAMAFVSLPFVIRTAQPVLQDIDREVEEAAATLGADRLQVFARVIFPTVFPAVLAGFAMAFARAVGEYGSVVFISGNMPGRTEIVPLLIMTRLEEYNYAGAKAVALALLVLSFLMLLVINLLQAWARRSAPV
ncbi:MAG: sulfate ABC transporter permease subunit CysT [Phycisphaerales bacterium]|nr:MAG: sulfate ABC transporter permease subunit CysT [Phycisphaerales bacterium]